MTLKRIGMVVLYIIVAVWIVGGTVVYYARFSGQFYREHASEIDPLIKLLRSYW